MYSTIMSSEVLISKGLWHTPNAEEVFSTVEQIAEFAKASSICRSYNKNYGLTDQTVNFESDGSHTNLMAAIIDRTLSYLYGPNFRRTDDGYSYREIMEAVRRHDLPENSTGDIPDDGGRDESKKAYLEQEYHREFNSKYPSRESKFEKRVTRLLYEMDHKSSSTGRIIYVADKVSALVITLFYDSIGLPPLRSLIDPTLTERDKMEMAICDCCTEDNYFYASEMWAIDYFKARSLVDYDDDGYLTALIIMYTLQVKNKWYNWREKDYETQYDPPP